MGRADLNTDPGNTLRKEISTRRGEKEPVTNPKTPTTKKKKKTNNANPQRSAAEQANREWKRDKKSHSRGLTSREKESLSHHAGKRKTPEEENTAILRRPTEKIINTVEPGNKLTGKKLNTLGRGRAKT